MEVTGIQLALAAELAKPDRSHLIVPDPGIYPGVPEYVYHHLWDAASNSRLGLMKRSPAHLKVEMDLPPDDSRTFRIGRAAHAAILEPDKFESEFVCSQQCMALKKGDGLRCVNNGIVLDHKGDWYCGVHSKDINMVNDKIVLPAGEHLRCLGMRDAVFAHETARELLSGEGEHELSLVWDDPITGLRCKARIDHRTPHIEGVALCDVKTTEDASRRAFERSLYRYGYHRQAAHYLTGASVLGIPAEHFVFVPVEKDRPHALALYRLSEGAVQLGLDELRPLYARYKKCRDTDTWPAYATRVEDISVPTYAWDQSDEDIGGMSQ